MSYRYVLSILGGTFIAFGLVEREWFIPLVWLGSNFLILGIAHCGGMHCVFGKRPNGIIPLWSYLLFFPFFLFTYVVWHLVRLIGRESAQNAVTEQLVIGRRLLPSEFHDGFDNYVDLTAEFSEPLPMRQMSSYRCFAILDGAAPSPKALEDAVRSLRPGRTFIHCAQGHGRTGLFALAVLLNSGVVRNIEDGLKMLTSVRPGVRLNKEQHACIQEYLKSSQTES